MCMNTHLWLLETFIHIANRRIRLFPEEKKEQVLYTSLHFVHYSSAFQIKLSEGYW